MMEFKLAQLDWNNILKDWVSGIYYTRRDWKRLSVTDESINNDWTHGRVTSPTFARVRIITLEWYIDRWDSEQNSIWYMESVFALSEWVDWKRSLYIVDNRDNEWTLDVKVKEPLSIDHADTNFPEVAWKRRVVLESIESPIYKSYQEILESWLEWQYGWIELECELESELDDYYNLIECETSWNQPTPARFVITCMNKIDSPLTIKNLSANNRFALDIDAVAWDVIIINSEDYTVTKNWINIAWDRIEWSIFPYISWTTIFNVYDLDWDLYEKDIQVDIYFRNNLL